MDKGSGWTKRSRIDSSEMVARLMVIGLVLTEQAGDDRAGRRGNKNRCAHDELGRICDEGRMEKNRLHDQKDDEREKDSDVKRPTGAVSGVFGTINLRGDLRSSVGLSFPEERDKALRRSLKGNIEQQMDERECEWIIEIGENLSMKQLNLV